MLTKIEEISLIARCVASDDRRAFARLVDAHSPGLHTFLYNLTNGDAPLTDDIAQETFLKAYTQIRNFKGLSRFRTWLYRIAINEFSTTMRRRHEERIPETHQFNQPDTTSHHARFETNHDIQLALNTLNHTERALVLLFFFEDRPIKEISVITQLPEGTVKSYLHRAKNKMRNFLNNDLLQ